MIGVCKHHFRSKIFYLLCCKRFHSSFCAHSYKCWSFYITMSCLKNSGPSEFPLKLFFDNKHNYYFAPYESTSCSQNIIGFAFLFCGTSSKSKQKQPREQLAAAFVFTSPLSKV